MRRLDNFEIYSDGSYLDDKVGYGAVILKNGECIKKIYGRVCETYATGSRQVGGEIKAVEHALTWCDENNIHSATVYYDFENIEKWAKGDYTANKPLTQEFKEFIEKCTIDINWVKVKSHTGIKWNDAADVLAKKGTLEEEYPLDNRKDVINKITPPSAHDSYFEELKEFCENFVNFLNDRGYNSIFKGVSNSCDGIIEIWIKESKVGNLHVYNTSKKKFSPAYNDIKREDYKSDLEKLFCIYKKN
ncbi:ribonuclease HI [Clostridium acetobutylicum]|nr:ribonuclease HI [Clostridium acetobutylicum]